jgi:hypothetical protein
VFGGAEPSVPTRSFAAGCLIGGALTLYGASASAQPDQAGRSCALGFGAGPRAGGTLNGDQWLAGGHAHLDLLCLGGLGSELVAVGGLGGNLVTLRGSLRLVYDFELWRGRRGLRLYPALGWSLQYYTPVGHFATWCGRYDVDACYGFASGVELGGGLRWSWLGAEVIVGLSDLPVLTLALSATFDLAGPDR